MWRPSKLKTEDVEMLKHDVLQDRESRTMSLADITMKLNSMLTTDVSQTTVRRVLKKEGIKCHAAAVNVRTIFALSSLSYFIAIFNLA